ncbi:MAG: hypothetical protein AAGA89_09650 [Pseudomonadota bacterium]
MTKLNKVLIAALMISIVPNYAHAYIGPGVGIGAIILTIAIAIGALLLLFGLVWYPVKRALARFRGNKSA